MTWLLVASDADEFTGVLKRASKVDTLKWNGVAFAREIEWNPGKTYLAANGPGHLAAQTMVKRIPVDGVMSVGFCGALDPSLGIGDIVIAGEFPGTELKPFTRGDILPVDHVVVTAAEKQKLFQSTGAMVAEMESAIVGAKAREWGVPFCSVKVVSDTAQQDMPLDFNRYRSGDGRFARGRIALAAAARPWSAAPGLIQLGKNCRRAAESLGDFLADCKI